MNPFIKRTVLALIISMFCRELSAKVAPDYIQICPGLTSDCLVDNIQRTIPHFVKGVPNLGLKPTDPQHFDYLKYDLPGGLKLEFFNATLTGLGKCIVDSVKQENLVADMKMHCGLVLNGKYKATGKIILFDLDGEGDSKINIKKLIMGIKISFEDKIRNGVEYREAKNIKTEYHFGDRVSFVFSNLFKGSPQLSQTILEFINENWKEVLDEFAKPVVESVFQQTLEVTKKFFKKIPKNELV